MTSSTCSLSASSLHFWGGSKKHVPLDSAKCAGLPFGLERDLEAVQAGVSTRYSNGIVEGHVNRLKLLKRQGYGRADVGLLRQRVLQAA